MHGLTPDDRADEHALLERARRGEGDAYGELVIRFQGLAARTAYLITRDRSEAEEAVQDAFVKAYQALGRFRVGEPFRPWLMRIVANEAKNHLRGRDRRNRRDERYGSWVIAAVPDPEASALDNDDARGLGLALGRLGTRDRQVLAYRFFAGLSEVETAEAVGVPIGTVKSRTARALTRLRTEMERP